MNPLKRFIATVVFLGFVSGLAASICSCAATPEERIETRQKTRVEQRTEDRMERRRD